MDLKESCQVPGTDMERGDVLVWKDTSGKL